MRVTRRARVRNTRKGLVRSQARQIHHSPARYSDNYIPGSTPPKRGLLNGLKKFGTRLLKASAKCALLGAGLSVAATAAGPMVPLMGFIPLTAFIISRGRVGPKISQPAIATLLLSLGAMTGAPTLGVAAAGAALGAGRTMVTSLMMLAEPESQRLM